MTTGDGGDAAGAERPGAPAPPVCPRHPGRASYVRCQRCERPVCPDCQRVAAVGFHCVDCVRAQPAAAPRTLVGSRSAGGRPVLTYAVLAVLGVVYLGQLAVPPLTEVLAFRPVLSLAEPWRFVTSGLVHAPTFPLHIGLNGFWLFVLGREFEPMLGRWRYAALLLLSTVGASVAVLWFTPVTSSGWFGLTIGASGAVFGVFGAVLAVNLRRGEPITRQAIFLAVLAGIGLFIPGISWQGHVGGLLSGTLVALVLVFAPREARLRWQVAGLLGVLALCVGLAVLRWVLVPDNLLVPLAFG